MFEQLRQSHVMQRGLMAMALCLVLLQSVVGMHRVLHVQNLNAPSAVNQLADSDTAASDPAKRATQGESHLVGLWGDHTRASDCQLLDQACADAWPLAIWLAPSHISTPCFLAHTLMVSWVKHVVFFSVRGPPVVC